MDDKNVQLALLGAVAVLAIVGLVLMIQGAQTGAVSRGYYPSAVSGVLQRGGSTYDVLAGDIYPGYVQDIERGRRVDASDISTRGYQVAYRSYGAGLENSLAQERRLTW